MTWLAIGDFLIWSDIIIAAVQRDRAAMKLLYEDRVLSESLVGFLAAMASGTFDFLEPL